MLAAELGDQTQFDTGQIPPARDHVNPMYAYDEGLGRVDSAGEDVNEVDAEERSSRPSWRVSANCGSAPTSAAELPANADRNPSQADRFTGDVAFMIFPSLAVFW